MTALDPIPLHGDRHADRTVGHGPPGFEEFFREYWPMVRRYLVWLEAELSVLDDAAQMTMVSAYTYWGRVSRMDQPRGWLFKVAGQRLQDARAARRRNGVPTDAETLHAQLGLPDPIAASDQRLDILAAIRKLPRRQQEAVALREQFGLPYKEIAQIMGAAPATVRAHVHQARRTLKEMLGDETQEGADA
ncbi:RNA polymerase sigma factor [Streptomyces sp. NPDC088785]|uniref:RNA polymerase sigma factor n=1 Tax=Streptomyces sp. NPDC088785 TaxID=3365897 RepID=UPI003822D44B